ncbi:MAG: ABC transporter [Micromonosporaceae bacterium]
MTTQGDTGVARPDGGTPDSDHDAAQATPETPPTVGADTRSQDAAEQADEQPSRPVDAATDSDPEPDPAPDSGPDPAADSEADPAEDADGAGDAADAGNATGADAAADGMEPVDAGGSAAETEPAAEDPAEGDPAAPEQAGEGDPPAPEPADEGSPDAAVEAAHPGEDADQPADDGSEPGDDAGDDGGDQAADAEHADEDMDGGEAAPAVAATAASQIAESAPETPVSVLAAALLQLRTALANTRFGLALPMADEAERQTGVLVSQLDDYLLPRLARIDAPMLVVVGGSTGAGKSTLVNSLLRAPVSPAGVLRPTTRSPVLVCNPDDVRWFGEANLLPDIPRANAAVDGPRLQVVTAEELPAGVAFLDAPDIDSVVDANRALAGQLLAAADLWLFLTTASRYADAVPWDVLRDAEERGAAVALVLDRVPDDGREIVTAHLQQMLVDHGFGDAPLFIVGEQQLDNQGLLAEEIIAPIRDWFAALARDAEQREAVVRQTLAGAVTSIHPRVDAIAVQADAQRDAAAGLRVTAQNAYTEAENRVENGLRDGALLRGEVLARWQELVGSGDLTRALETRIGKWRDQLRAAITGRPLPGRKFQAALSSGTTALIIASAADAAEQTAAQWATHPAGRALLETPNGDRLRYYRPSPDLEERAEKLINEWQRWVLELVRTEAGNKRSVARLTAYTVNATGLLVMIGVFASTAFIPTGAEVAVAGGTTVASQKLLEAIFGDQAVRQLAGKAKQNLLDRVRVLFDDERQRYTDLLHETGVDPAAADRLRSASGDVERARVAAGLLPTRDALANIPIPAPQPIKQAPPAADDAAGSQPTEDAEDTDETADDGKGGANSTVEGTPKTTRRKQ